MNGVAPLIEPSPMAVPWLIKAMVATVPGATVVTRTCTGTPASVPVGPASNPASDPPVPLVLLLPPAPPVPPLLMLVLLVPLDEALEDDALDASGVIPLQR